MIYSARLNSSLENPLKFVKREKSETIQQKVQKDFQYLRNFTFYVAWPGRCNFSLPSWKDRGGLFAWSCWDPCFLLGKGRNPGNASLTSGHHGRQNQRGSPLVRLAKTASEQTAGMAAVMAMSLLGQQIKSSVSHRGKDSLVSVVLLCALKYNTLWGTRCVVFPSISRKAT